jgi:hypothetical protein
LIHYLKHNQIDTLKWNRAIDSSVNALVYAYSWYLDVVCPNWEALVLNDYEVVMPLTTRHKFGVHYLYNPVLVQQLGISSSTIIDEKLVEKFIDHIPKLIKFAEINLNFANVISKEKYSIKSNQNFILELNKHYSQLHSSYSENTQRNLKKSRKHNLEITYEISIDDVIELFKNDKGLELENFSDQNYITLKQIHPIIMSHCLGSFVAGIKDENKKLLAAAFFIVHKSRITFIFSGNSFEGKKLGAMTLLIDCIINKHCNSEMILDFEGSNDFGLGRFYKSFGAINQPYVSLKINKLPLIYRLLKK